MVAAGDPVPGLRVNGVSIGEGRTGPLTVGRSPSCDVVLANPVVSTRHATIAPEGGTWVFRDAGSTNGSYLDGVRTDAVPVTGRAVLMLGHPVEGARLEIETVGAPAPAPPRYEAPPATEPRPPVPPPWAPASPPVPGPPGVAPVPGVRGVPILQSRVAWMRTLRRDDLGTLRLVGERVILTSDEQGQVLDAPAAGLRARFPPDDEATIIEIEAEGRMYRLSFAKPEGVGVEHGRYAAVAWRQALAAHAGPAASPGLPPPPAPR